MKSRAENRVLSQLVKASFLEVSKCPDLRKKLTTVKSWLQLINAHKLGGDILKKWN